MKFYTLFLLLFLFGCADSMRSASKTLKITENFMNEDMTWILKYESIYFSGEIIGNESSFFHGVKSIEACNSFNENELLASMFEKGLLPQKFTCIPYNKELDINKGLLIKQTSDSSILRQDYYYVDHVDLSTGYIINREDIIQATYKEYKNIWLLNSILPLITASRQQYGNDLKWKEEFDLVCNSVKSVYC